MLDIDFTFFVQWINFLAIMGIIHFFLVKPVLKFVEERKRMAGRDLEEANKKEQAARDIFAAMEVKLSLLHKEVNEEMNRFRSELSEMSHQKIEKARNEALSMVDLARQGIQQEVNQVKDQLRSSKEKMALMVTEKILGRSITA